MNFETVSGPFIPRYKRGHSGKKLTIKADPIIKASYDSALKLDGDSRAFSSDQFPYGPLDRLAVHGIVPLIPKVLKEE